MATISETLSLAVKHHQSGDLDTAERLYRDILAHDSRQPDAWHLLGLVYYTRGQYAEAIDHIERAIALDGAQASFHNHLAEALLVSGRSVDAESSCRRGLALQPEFAIGHNTLGTVLAVRSRIDEAIASYRRAIGLSPRFAQAHFNLGQALESQGATSEAEASYRRALVANPDYALALHALAMMLLQQKRHADAAELYRRVVTLQPDHAEAHCNLGSALNALNRPAEAISCFERALALSPRLAEAHFNLGFIYQTQKKWPQAEDAYRRAVEAQPNHVGSHNNLGTVYRNQGKLSEAVRCFERVLEFKPDVGEVLSNLGNVFTMQGRRAEAMVCYDQSVRMRPDYAQAHTNRALAWLAQGDFAAGWEEYEWRWKCPEFQSLGHDLPMWDGSPLDGRALLVHAEQGFGDTLQFIRFVPSIATDAGRVVCEVQPPVASLLKQSGIPGVFAQGEALPACDVWIPLLSLPRLFGTTLETIPHEVPYLAADPARISRWREVLAGSDNFRVAIAWRGRPTYRGDRFRSIDLSLFEPLARMSGVQLVSVQKGAGAEQVAEVASDWPLVDASNQLTDFHDTAAAIANVDLVIACDTAVAHLAGALGVPTWIALPFSSDWRWLIDREDSPWYPSVRLFRQTTFDDWPEVFQRLTAALRELVKNR